MKGEVRVKHIKGPNKRYVNVQKMNNEEGYFTVD